ncbi:MAG: hypothetical protein ACK5NB_05180 [Flavobacteriaceae bacterium]
MKSNHFLKTVLAIVAFATFGALPLHSLANPNPYQKTKVAQSNNDGDITVTVDKNTTEDNFNDIKNMLSEYGITAEFSNIERNDTKELTGIKIKLSDGRSTTASGFSGNMPMGQVSFGRKNGALFISQGNGNGQNMLSLFGNMPNMQAFGFSQDSIAGMNGLMNGFNFDDFFNGENGTFSLNGQNLNMDELRKQLEEQFGGDMFSSFFGNSNPNGQKFNFTDDPDTEKLIVIDGKESNFETLKNLAETNKIEAVDHLKPQTAISLYGEKAKDGAIIVTTK